MKRAHKEILQKINASRMLNFLLFSCCMLAVLSAHSQSTLTSSAYPGVKITNDNAQIWLYGDGQHKWSIGSTGALGSDFVIYDKQTPAVRVLIDDATGNVGIGTPSPDSKLTVKGKIHAEEVKVDLSVPGPDYVFEESYKLTTLEELKKYIQENKHLPEIPSAQEMEENGIQLGEMNMKLLEKVEELTLYILQQEENLKAQKDRNDKLEERLVRLEEVLHDK